MLVGSTISHYRSTEELGEVYICVVYKDEDTKPERTVAFKFLAGNLLNVPKRSSASCAKPKLRPGSIICESRLPTS